MAQPYIVNQEAGEIETQALSIIPQRVQLDSQKLAVIKATLAPTLTTPELAFFGHVCQRMQLDPFARQIYAIKRGDKLTIQVGIDGFRALAERTGLYRGQLGPLWCGPDGKWLDCWLADEAPAAAKVGILRSDFAEPLWAVARTKAYRVDNNSLWQKMPEVMIAKCAEALALRKAFPDALGGAYEGAEMDQADDPQQQVRQQVTVVDEAEYHAQQAVANAPPATRTASVSKAAKPSPANPGFEELHLRAKKALEAVGRKLSVEDWESTCQQFGGAIKPADMTPDGKQALRDHIKELEQAASQRAEAEAERDAGYFPREADDGGPARSTADDPDALTKLNAAPLQ